MDATQPLLNLLANFDMKMALPKDIPTLEALCTKNYTRPDNVFCSSSLADSFLECNTHPEARPPHTNHLPIISILDIKLPMSIPAPKRNFRKTNWKDFRKSLEQKLDRLPPAATIHNVQSFNSSLSALTHAIKETIREEVPETRPTPFPKWWWTQDLAATKAKVRKAGRTAYSNRACREHPWHEQYRRLRNDYVQLIKCTKQDYWATWLEEADELSIWTANRITSGPSSDGGRARIPALKSKGANGEAIEVRENSAKSKLLYEGFFPPAGTCNTDTLDPDYPPPSLRLHRDHRHTD